MKDSSKKILNLIRRTSFYFSLVILFFGIPELMLLYLISRSLHLTWKNLDEFRNLTKLPKIIRLWIYFRVKFISRKIIRAVKRNLNLLKSDFKILNSALKNEKTRNWLKNSKKTLIPFKTSINPYEIKNSSFYTKNYADTKSIEEMFSEIGRKLPELENEKLRAEIESSHKGAFSEHIYSIKIEYKGKSVVMKNIPRKVSLKSVLKSLNKVLIEQNKVVVKKKRKNEIKLVPIEITNLILESRPYYLPGIGLEDD